MATLSKLYRSVVEPGIRTYTKVDEMQAPNKPRFGGVVD